MSNQLESFTDAAFGCLQVSRLWMSSGKPPLDVFTDAAFRCLQVSRLWMSSQMPHSDVFMFAAFGCLLMFAALQMSYNR